jgi:hypothetical protein
VFQRYAPVSRSELGRCAKVEETTWTRRVGLVDRKSGAYAALVILLLVSNLITMVIAYPETLKLDSGCCAPGSGPLARDFSAFYVGSWRLFHNPSQIYTKGYLSDGEPFIAPQPEQYKYLPSFLFLISPLLLLSYQSALTAFDVFQFLLLPLVALMLFRLTKGTGILVSSLVAIAVLLQPSPFPNWGLSVSYYWQWAEAQPKVLLTFLIVLAFYLAKTGHSKTAGVAFGLACFDPRFVVIAVPLFAAYTKGKAPSAWGYFFATLAASNLTLLLPGVGNGFIEMVLSVGLSTPLYYYSWIPLISIISLTAVDWKRVKLLLMS